MTMTAYVALFALAVYTHDDARRQRIAHYIKHRWPNAYKAALYDGARY